MSRSEIPDTVFRQALQDYSYLLERKYPDRGILKFIGDRYRLNTEERTLLYRGIFSREHCAGIASRLIKVPEGKLVIDGYNVLITLLNYRLGNRVFISNDGLCRDTGSLFGKIRDVTLFGECAALLSDYLSHYPDTESIIYLDEPVSHSKNHKKILDDTLNEKTLKVSVVPVPSADEALVMHRTGTLATSDSGILGHTKNPVLDIPGAVIKKRFGGRLMELREELKNNCL